MDVYGIKNLDMLIEQINDLLQTNENVSRACEYLTTYIKQIEQNWQSTTEDKETYLLAAKKNLEELYSLNNTIINFSKKMREYAENTILIQNKGVENI